MPAVISVVVDNYEGPASMNIAGVNAVPVIPAVAQWEVKGNVCQRK